MGWTYSTDLDQLALGAAAWVSTNGTRAISHQHIHLGCGGAAGGTSGSIEDGLGFFGGTSWNSLGTGRGNGSSRALGFGNKIAAVGVKIRVGKVSVEIRVIFRITRLDHFGSALCSARTLCSGGKFRAETVTDVDGLLDRDLLWWGRCAVMVLGPSLDLGLRNFTEGASIQSPVQTAVGFVRLDTVATRQMTDKPNNALGESLVTICERVALKLSAAVTK